jgi:hypothetical protein
MFAFRVAAVLLSTLIVYGSVGDPDPQLSRMFFGLPDPGPDPLVSGTDPDPAPYSAPDPSFFT